MADTYQNEQQPNKRCRVFLILLLIIIVSITSCILGYILGQRAGIQRGGEIIDNIILSPENPIPEGAQWLSFSGVLRYPDGTPAPYTLMELQKDGRVTVTDENGYFFFHLSQTGEHHFYVKDNAGRIIASCPVEIDAQARYEAVTVYWNEATGYLIEVPLNMLLLELDLVLDMGKDGAEPRLVVQNVKSIQKDGAIVDEDGADVPQSATIVTTEANNQVCHDGTVKLANGYVLLNDHTLIMPDGSVYKPDGTQEIHDKLIKTDNGSIHLPTILVVTPGCHVITFRGDIVHPDGSLTLSDGTIIDGRTHMVTLPDGTVLNPQAGTAVLPDGTEIDVTDSSAKLPEGVTVDPETGNIILPDGTVVKPETGEVTLPDGTVVDNKEGTVTAPDGTIVNRFEETVTSPDGEVLPIGPTDTTPVKPGDFVVSSEGKIWTQNTHVNLFKYIERLYPGVECEYLFKVSNNLSHAVSYSITVTDDHTNPIPFVLTLYDDKGREVTPEKQILASGKEIYYTLHWLWPYESGNDAYDTTIGNSDDLMHTVTISISGEAAE